MKYYFFFPIWCFCLCHTAFSQVFPTQALLYSGPDNKRINFVYVSDGYQSAQLNTFITNATAISNTMMAQQPFLQYKNFFNAYAIKVPSTQSGAKHAGTATDVTEPASPVQNPNNYFGSRFDVSNIHRLLVPGSSTSVVSVANSNKPEYDQLLVVVNDGEYGGSGGFLATCSTNGSAAEIMIHEVGHSFANLGDEYWFDCGERKNRTANSSPSTIIWKNWLNTNGVGIYPFGTSAPQSACFRPHQNCKMRSLGLPFCAVCVEAFIDKIYSLVSPIDAFTPANNNVTFTGATVTFDLDLILPNPNTLKIEWLLNGNVIANDVETVNIGAVQLNTGSNTLTAKVTDATTLSRSYWPATSGYLHTVTWTINNTPAPVELLQFDVNLLNEKARLHWQTATESGSAYFEAERSDNGTDFFKIGRVKAAGYSNSIKRYQLEDINPLYGVTYYRIRQVDANGSSTYSPVRTVNRIGKLRYEIFPNPADALLHIQITGAPESPVQLTLTDLQGRLVKQQEYPFSEPFAAQIPMEGMPAGTYTLVIKAGDVVHRQLIEKL
jgi:hypothetical protein